MEMPVSVCLINSTNHCFKKNISNSIKTLESFKICPLFPKGFRILLFKCHCKIYCRNLIFLFSWTLLRSGSILSCVTLCLRQQNSKYKLIYLEINDDTWPLTSFVRMFTQNFQLGCYHSIDCSWILFLKTKYSLLFIFLGKKDVLIIMAYLEYQF